MLDWDASCRDDDDEDGLFFVIGYGMPFANVAFQPIVYHNIPYKYNTDMLYYKGIKVFVADEMQLTRIPYLAINLFTSMLSIYPQNTIQYNRGIPERQEQNWY